MLDCWPIDDFIIFKEKKDDLYDLSSGHVFPIFSLFKTLATKNLFEQYQTLTLRLRNLIETKPFQIYCLTSDKITSNCFDPEERRVLKEIFSIEIPLEMNEPNVSFVSKQIQQIFLRTTKWNYQKALLDLLLLFDSSEKVFASPSIPKGILPTSEDFTFNAPILVVFHILYFIYHSYGEISFFS